MELNYYYNNVPGQGLCRNNLIYTSLISNDRRTFVQWYHNDTEYHNGKNQVVDPDKMEEKWNREMHFLHNMAHHYPDLVPKILEVNVPDRKIYLEIDGVDFWQQSLDSNCSFDDILPDWQEQMLNIIRSHRARGWHKYSMHPSSYFVVEGRLKSINYFFTYHESERNITIGDVESHIHVTRQEEMRKHIDSLEIRWNEKQSWETFDNLCWESFRTNYPSDFIEKAKCIK